MPTRHVVIIGASTTGLFAAAAAARAGCAVSVLERDVLPAEPLARPSVPQDVQPHVFLHRGLLAAEQLLPGFRDDLLDAGAVAFDTARAALIEMRRLLGVLREDTDGSAVALRPQPGLGQLNDLLDEARDATGSGTRLILTGRPVILDPGVELAAYRIVQEALTNCRRHAPGAAVDVELAYRPTELRILIRDDGPGGGATGGAVGHGLLGMRERASAVGGRLRSGPGRSGGFLVEAVLPAGQRDLS